MPVLNPQPATPPASAANVAATPATATPNNSADSIYEDNVLSSYDQPTYHFKFYTTGDGVTSASNPVIIAETGVTSYNIKEVHIQSLVAPSNTQKNAIATEIKMTIVEPVGYRFLDSLFESTKSTGIKNWQKANYKLDLSFEGWETDGKRNMNLCSKFPNGGIWSWEVVIVDIETTIDAGGGTYVLKMIPLYDQALTKEIAFTYDKIVIKAETVKDFFESLGTQLTDFSKKSNNGVALNTYKFEFAKFKDADPGSWKLVDETKSDYNPHRHFEMKRDDKKLQISNLVRGTPISTVVEDIIAITKEGQAAIKGLENPDPNYTGKGEFRYASIPMVFPDIKVTGYDETTKQYQRTITYKVKFYPTQRSYLNAKEVENDNGQAAINLVKSYDGLKKKYQYLFTGLNTEVLHLDLKFNLAWSALLPRFDGVGYLNENFAIPPKTKDEERKKYTKPPDPSQGGISDNTVQSPQTQLQNPQAFQNNNSSSPSGGNAAIYAEDFVVSKTNPTLVSISRGAEGVMREMGTGIVGQVTPARSLAAAVMNQVYEPFSTSLMRITIRIKGDPYWLGQPLPEMMKTENTANVANFTTGDTCFQIAMLVPVFQEDQNKTEFRFDDVFNGMYVATRVTNDFTNGLFTQTLEGIRNARVLPEQVRANENKVSLSSPNAALQTPNSSTTPTNLPAAPLATPATPQAPNQNDKLLSAKADALGLPSPNGQANGVVEGGIVTSVERGGQKKDVTTIPSNQGGLTNNDKLAVEALRGSNKTPTGEAANDPSLGPAQKVYMADYAKDMADIKKNNPNISYTDAIAKYQKQNPSGWQNIQNSFDPATLSKNSPNASFSDAEKTAMSNKESDTLQTYFKSAK